MVLCFFRDKLDWSLRDYVEVATKTTVALGGGSVREYMDYPALQLSYISDTVELINRKVNNY